jgi:multisubunit Na+/H+ antiporter MnhB subunit
MYINTMGVIVIGIVICVISIIFFALAYKKNELIDDIFMGNRTKKHIERIDTWLSILIWCEVVLFIGLILVL